jgi:predicted metal-dependent phosphoesterase TrpH
MPKADLHTHSTVSDGRLSPAALVERAAAQGVALMALTDHDNVGGVAEAEAAGRRHGVAVIPGVEISADFEPGTMHILGLAIDPGEAALLSRLDFLQSARRERNPRVIQKLRAQGIEITLAEVEALAGFRQVGRPHFAQALVNKKAVATFEEAFRRFLAKGQSAYVPKTRLAPKEAISLIHGAGGLAVLAHPIQLGLEDAALEAQIGRLKELGLDGIEVYHSDHELEHEQLYEGLAKKFSLGISGGSDFHGIPGKDVELGRPQIDVSVVRALLSGKAP